MSWDVCPAADVITQPYGCTDYAGEWADPNCSSGHFHAGVDLGSSAGGWSIYRSPVYATRPGIVVAVGIQYLGPAAVGLHTDEGVYLEFGHLDSASVAVGDQVLAGHQLGLLGTQGSSTAPHLHLEARTDGATQGLGATIDPTPYLMRAHAGDVPMTADERFDVARCIVRLAYVVCRGQEPENLDVLNAHAKEMADGSDMEAVLAGMLDKGEFATELAQRRQLMGDYLVGKLAGAPGPPGPDVRPQVAAALEAAAKQLTS